MSRSSNQTGESVSSSVPRSAPPVETAAKEGDLVQRIPFKWRVVLGVWVVSFAILVLYEVMVLVGKLFLTLSK